MTNEQAASSLLDIDIPAIPQKIPGYISTLRGWNDTLEAIQDYLVGNGLPPIKTSEGLDLETYYLRFGAVGGIPVSRTIWVYSRLSQTKIERPFRCRR